MTVSNLSSRLTRALALACVVSLGAAHLIAGPPQRPESNAAPVLRGRVGIAGNGFLAPVRRAHVTLTGGTPSASHVADTDAEGRFEFAGLTAGPYRIAVAKAGFVMSSAGSGVPAEARMDVQVGAGETTTPDVVMMHAAAIEGRVSDMFGSPAINVLVRAQLIGVNAATPVIAQQTRTDDGGRYRLHTLNAGAYVIDVTAGDPRLVQAGAAGAAGRPEPARTYYPSAARVEEAQRVVAPAGQDVRGIDVTLVTAAPAPPFPVGASPNATAAGAGLPVGTARIAGRVTQSDGGRPVAGATLALLRWEGGRGTQSVRQTDDQGGFEFTGLVAGNYQLTARADGFLDREYGWTAASPAGTRLDLTADARMDQVNIALPRPGAVEGRIVDEFGDPVPGVSVQIASVQFVAGQRRLLPVGNRIMPRPTDDAGTFRIFNLPPDEYYVMALSGAFALEGDAAGFAPTFYPSTRVATSGTPVRVALGKDAVGTDFALIPSTMSTVSGVAVDASGQPMSRASILLMQTNGGDVRMVVIARTSTGPDGSFAFRNVALGSYAIQAFGATTGGSITRGPFGSLTFTTTGATTAGLRVEVKTGASLRGRVVFEGDGVPPGPRDVLISPQPTSFIFGPMIGGGPPETVWADDGTFEVKNLSGISAIRAQARPDTWTVARMMMDGRDITDTPIDFRNGDINGLDITFTNRAASVTGTVTNDGKPAPDYGVIVFSADRNTWTYPSRRVLLARPNQQGSFRIAGVPPGSYLAIALDRVHPTGWQDPEFLQTLRANATPFTLGTGESKTLSLRLMKP